jgi:hypothetical protein
MQPRRGFQVMAQPTRKPNPLSIDAAIPNSWEVWKKRAEDSGLPAILGDAALMLLYVSLGSNAWRKQ